MKSLLKSGSCLILGLLASSAMAQETVKWKASANSITNPPAISQTVGLSQPSPLDSGQPAGSFGVLPTPAPVVRGQMFQIEPLLTGDEKKLPKEKDGKDAKNGKDAKDGKDKGFVPPPPTPVNPSGPTAAAFPNMSDDCCDSGCGLGGWCGWCSSRIHSIGSLFHGMGGGCCDDCDRYRTWVSAEYLMWWQKNQNTPPLVTSNPAGTPFGLTGILGVSTVAYGATPDYLHSGARIGIGTWFQHFCCNLGIEVNYFFLARQSSSSTFDSNGDPGLGRPFFDVVAQRPASEPFAVQGLVSGSATIHDYTQLWGIESNLRYKWCSGPNYWVDLLFGYRYLSLSEGIDISEFANRFAGLPAGISTLEQESFATENKFNGFQVGIDSEHRIGERWFVGMNAKIAVGAINQTVLINGSTTFSGFPPPLQAFNGTAPGALLASPTNIGRWTDTRCAYAPEIGLKIGYNITEHLRVYVGYDFLYISNVVRPGDQIDLNVNQAFRPQTGPNGPMLGQGNFQNPLTVGPRAPAVLFRTSDYWAQGLNFGLMYRF